MNSKPFLSPPKERPPLISHLSSPSTVSLSSVYSCASLSSSTSTSSDSTGFTDLETPHQSPPLRPASDVEKRPARRGPLGARPRPKVVVSITAPPRDPPSASKSTLSPPRIISHSRSPSLPNPPRVTWSTDTPAAGELDIPPFPSSVISTPISGTSLSRFPLPPDCTTFAPVPTRARTPPIASSRPPPRRQGTKDSFFSFTFEDADMYEREYSSGTELGPPPIEEDVIDWGRLEKTLGTWRASRRGMSREVTGALDQRVLPRRSDETDR